MNEAERPLRAGRGLADSQPGLGEACGPGWYAGGSLGPDEPLACWALQILGRWCPNHFLQPPIGAWISAHVPPDPVPWETGIWPHLPPPQQGTSHPSKPCARTRGVPPDTAAHPALHGCQQLWGAAFGNSRQPPCSLTSGKWRLSYKSIQISPFATFIITSGKSK